MKAVRQLMREGAREICTPADSCLVRTVVQWDGDVITFVSPEALARSELIEQHFQQVGECFQAFRWVNLSLRGLANLGVAIPLLPLWQLYRHPRETALEIASLFLPYVLGSALCLSAPVLMRWYLRRAITISSS